MANIATMPSRDARPPDAAPQATAIEVQAQQTAGPTGMAGIESHADWPLLQRLPMRLTAGVPLPGFRVKHLLALKPGSVIESAWRSTDDVLLKIGGVQLSWSELEVVERRLAIRLTRLA